MKIHNTATYFLDQYIPAAIKKYPGRFKDMKKSSQNIEPSIRQTVDAYQ